MSVAYRYIALLASLCFSAAATAQSGAPRVAAAIEPDSIGIGDRFTVTVTVDKDATQVVEFPSYKDNRLDNGMEIVGQRLDTVSREGRNVKLRKTYEMTVFDEGRYNMGRIPVLYVDKNIVDTLYSAGDSLRIDVYTFEIDTLTQTIYDIKRPMDTPMKAGEIVGYIVWGIIFIVLLALGIYLTIQSRRGRGGFLWKPKRVEPPHVVAINGLKALHAQKLWQSGKHKAYYTRLTDILREYMERRYDIRAMEMTSDEILDALKGREMSDKNNADLRALLKLADLVKFAKYVPDAEDNENSYNGAFYFVEDTKMVESEISTESLETMEDEQ